MADKIYKLSVTLSNGTEVDAGNIVVPQGAQGIQGVQGPKGEQGETGPQGAQGVSITGATLTLVTA